MSEPWQIQFSRKGRWADHIALPGENGPLQVRQILLPLVGQFSALRAVRAGEEIRISKSYYAYTRQIPAEVLAP